MIKLVIADDMEVIRQMLRTRFARSCDIVGEAGDGATAIKLVRELSPHALIVDYRMPDMTGAEVALRVKEIAPDVRVLGYTSFAEESYDAFMDAGADAAIDKRDLAELARKLQETAGNQEP